MIEFSCPKCDADLEAESDDAGTKLACPECGQVMTVPGSKPVKKSNSAITPQKSAPKTSLTRRPAPVGAGKSKRPARDDEDEVEDDADDDQPSEKKGSSKSLFVILGVGGGLVAVALVAAGVM